MKSQFPIKVWGPERTSWTGQEEGQEKNNFFGENVAVQNLTFSAILATSALYFALSGPFLDTHQVFGMRLRVALTRGIQLTHILSLSKIFLTLFRKFLRVLGTL